MNLIKKKNKLMKIQLEEKLIFLTINQLMKKKEIPKH